MRITDGEGKPLDSVYLAYRVEVTVYREDDDTAVL
jgi:hypothetical protein